MSETVSWTPTDEAFTWAHSYLGPALDAARRLSTHDNKGAARIGRRVVRYVEFSTGRLALLLDGLNAKQRAAIGILPVLIHSNQEGLPGFLQTRFPIFGIQGFELNAMIERCARLAISAEIQAFVTPVERPLFQSILVESSVGTIGQRNQVEMSVYLVASVRSLGDAPLKSLMTKLELLAKWYAQADIQITFTVLDPVWTSQGHFGQAGGDRAQGYLKLDWFYRNATLLCGAVPIYWCTAPATPQDQYEKAASMIQRVDFDKALNFVDLGQVILPKPAVRRRAMLGLLNHEPHSPLSFVLSLVHLTFGSNASLALSEHLKLAVFKYGFRSEVIDPYLFHFDSAMVVLNHHAEWSALQVLRDLIIAKVGMRAHRLTYSKPAFMSELSILKPMLTRWGWDTSALELTDNLNTLSKDGSHVIHRRLNEFVIGLYRRLATDSKKQKGRFDEEEFALLGRRLLAHFSTQSGRIPPHYAYVLHETIARNVISIREVQDEGGERVWSIWAGHSDSELGQMDEVWTSKSLLTGLSFVAANDIYRTTSVLDFDVSSSRFNRGVVADVLSASSKMLGRLDPIIIDSHRLNESPRIVASIIVLNFEELDGVGDENRAGRKHYLPSNWDILNYGREQESRLRDVAVISVDSWDSCHLRRARGRDAVRKAMGWIYENRTYQHRKPNPPSVFAPDGREHRAAQDRIHQLVLKIESQLEQALRFDECSSFVYEVGNRFQVLQRRGDEVKCFRTNDLGQALRFAAPSQLTCKQIQFDSLSPSLTLSSQLRERANRDKDGEVFVVWRRGQTDTELLVLDSRNQFYRAVTSNKRFEALLVGTLRRLIHLLRDRAHDMRTLRKLLRVYEAKEGQDSQRGLQLTDDTVRALRYVGAHPPSSLQVTIGGDFSESREGLYLECVDSRFSAESSGRRFTLECVLHILEQLGKSKESGFKIEVSNLDLGGIDGSGQIEAVKHLRLMDMFQRQLIRAVSHLKAGGKKVLNSRNHFRSGDLHA